MKPDLSWILGYERLEGYDLIYADRGWRLCGECAKYHDRVYSISGENPNFPKFPEYFINQEHIKHGCHINFWLYTENISILRGKGAQNPVQYSNRPFEDDRTPEEKNEYDTYILEQAIQKKDKDDYAWICENMSDIAPKSFGGYKKMKNSNSVNYQKIVARAAENGYII